MSSFARAVYRVKDLWTRCWTCTPVDFTADEAKDLVNDIEPHSTAEWRYIMDRIAQACYDKKLYVFIELEARGEEGKRDAEYYVRKLKRRNYIANYEAPDDRNRNRDYILIISWEEQVMVDM